jgi:hypothetical protein
MPRLKNKNARYSAICSLAVDYWLIALAVGHCLAVRPVLPVSRSSFETLDGLRGLLATFSYSFITR